MAATIYAAAFVSVARLELAAACGVDLNNRAVKQAADQHGSVAVLQRAN